MKCYFPRWCALLFAFFVLFMGCSKKDQPTQTQNDDAAGGVLIPLKLGNSWKYRDEDRREYTWTVIEEKEILREHMYGFPYDGTELEWLSNRTDGVYGYSREYFSFKEGIYMRWKYPARVGESFLRLNLNSHSLVLASVKDSDVRVVTPAGDFRCLLYEMVYNLSDGKTETLREFFHPGIGLVRGEYIYSYAPGATSTEELIEYKIN